MHRLRERKKDLLTVLGELHKWKDAWESDVGQEILSDVVSEYGRLLLKIANPHTETTLADKCLYRVYYELIDKWTKRIAFYEEKLKEVKGGETKETL